MKRINITVIAVLTLCLMVAGLLGGCGSGAADVQEPSGGLSADEAYQEAISAEEGEECTSDECTVQLYDDNGDYPYSVLSPVGAISASNP